MIILFNKETRERITDFGSNTNEMTPKLWQYVSEKFNLTEADVLIGEFSDDFTGKDLSQMVASVTDEVITGWSAPDFVPGPPEPQPPTLEERTRALEDAMTVIMGI